MKPVFQWVYTPQATPERSTAPGRSSTGAISQRIEQAFAAASSSTGTPFEYLLDTARRESAMDPNARARTSSATGLFQFVESTWLETLKTSGPELGFSDIADRIAVDGSGRYVVPDPRDREEILGLRSDPEISAMMAGALTRRNAAYLEGRIGRQPTRGELYVAHFLGAAGASSLIRLAAAAPDAPADDYFPRQAAANRAIFYRGGVPLSVSEVYAGLTSSHDGEGTAEPAAMLTAFAPPTSPMSALPDTSARRVDDGWRVLAAGDAFSGLFRTDGPSAAGPSAASFWQTYSVAPALFDLAAAEDAKALAAEAAAAAAAAPLPRPSPSLIERAVIGGGPLDLSRFLDIEKS